MSSFDAVPVWAALLVGACLVIGAAITLAGTIGLARFGTFYQRIHAPTLGSSFGTGFVLLASMLFFSVTETRPVLHELLILVFVIVTTPVTLMLLARAALYRDRAEGNDVFPEPAAPPDGAGPEQNEPPR
ncbi:MAG: cation:proton antiporter [Devosia sp. 67-54]|uniref:monovalent cation/H(+) antiporter subunit G n=1 Tax=unclassified Devosia TaxID=196773 RepID=UPI000960512F|nr:MULTISPECIES: monovalent cation/H(+) antiporter subunit G [unclassified Devosia]MBN9306643.1 cation:proton antiporter [Devosia sp.]OJX15918.1 MAG: cation:proton antiporter [Devosia sp. 67-54]